MNDAQDMVLVAGLVAALRKQFPQIDGLYTLVAVAIASALVAIVGGGDAHAVVTRAIRVCLGAVGGVSLVSYAVGEFQPIAPPDTSGRDLGGGPGAS